jgi:UDP-hydrolysing UDP-N-acetyl-D-glucosamine 2-epimerase
LSKRQVAVFTGTRAEYGLLYWVLREIADHPDLELLLMVGGAHLSPEFGRTVQAIENDGFSIAEEVESLLSSDSPDAIAKTMALGLIGASDALKRHRPDLLLLLGDRYEIMPWAQASLLHRIPVAHAHGGELTEGAIDDAIRHAVTKMAHLHFTAAEEFRQRVIQLGEAPERVVKVGALGLDQLERSPVVSREELEGFLGLPLKTPVLVCTYHPETLSETPPEESMKRVLDALATIPAATIIFTYPNADTGGRSLIPLIEDFVAARASRAVAVKSLGSARYLSLLRLADAVVGNSSSGLIEAPAVGVPTVNIGGRQDGRPRASSVYDVEEDSTRIAETIVAAIDPEAQRASAVSDHPYGSPGAAGRIVNTLASIDLSSLIHKTFFDLPRGAVPDA